MQTRLLLLLLLLLTKATSAQEAYWRKYGYSDGLPSLQIFDLYSKKNGELYLAGNTGLLKYNGIRFNKIPFREHAAATSYLKEDLHGTLWAKDFTNRLFYLKNDTIEELKSTNQILLNQTLIDYEPTAEGLILATENRLLLLLHNQSKPKILFALEENDHNSISSFVVTDSFYCVSTYEGLYLINKINGTIEYQLKMLLNRTELVLNDHCLYFSSRGKNKGNAWEFNLSTRKIRSFGALPPEIHSNYLRWWQGQSIWCTNNGVYRYDSLKAEFSNFLLQQKRVSDLLEDHQGNVWISTLDHGLFQVPYMGLKQFYSANSSNEQLLTICLNRFDDLYIGGNLGSIWKINKHGQQTSISKTETNNEIQFLVVHPDNQQVYSSEGIHHAQTTALARKDYFGNTLALGPKNQIIYGTQSGVFISDQSIDQYPVNFNGKRQTFQHAKTIRLRNVRARFAYYSKLKKRYYVAYSDGLFTYDLNGQQSILTDHQNKALLVNQLVENEKGEIWLCTLDRGLVLLDADTVKSRFHSVHGLSSNQVRKAVSAANGDLWVLTDSGLDFFDQQSMRFIQYQNTLALGNVVVFDIATNAEYLFMATSVGVLRMPFRPKLNHYAPKIIDFSIRLNGTVLQGKRHDLPAHHGILNIKFTPLHFNSEGKVYPQYRILPSKQSWITLSVGTQEINLLNLPSGENIVEIRLFANGIYSRTERWVIFVQKPFWARWSFVGLSVSLVVFITIFLNRKYNRRKEQSLVLQQQLATSQLTAMKAQMSPHFLYNVLNSIQGLIYANKKVEATDYLGKFSDLMRLTLNFSNEQWHPLIDEISALQLYLDLEASRFDGELTPHIDLDNALLQKNPQVPSMLLQPFLENAIKHGLMHKSGSKHLEICFEEDSQGKALIVTIDDNGIGRKQAGQLQQKRNRQHHSFATKAINTRVNILNQLLHEPITVDIIDKYNDAKLPVGTKVVIRIPFQLAID